MTLKKINWGLTGVQKHDLNVLGEFDEAQALKHNCRISRVRTKVFRGCSFVILGLGEFVLGEYSSQRGPYEYVRLSTPSDWKIRR